MEDGEVGPGGERGVGEVRMVELRGVGVIVEGALAMVPSGRRTTFRWMLVWMACFCLSCKNIHPTKMPKGGVCATATVSLIHPCNLPQSSPQLPSWQIMPLWGDFWTKE